MASRPDSEETPHLQGEGTHALGAGALGTEASNWQETDVL